MKRVLINIGFYISKDISKPIWDDQITNCFLLLNFFLDTEDFSLNLFGHAHIANSRFSLSHL